MKAADPHELLDEGVERRHARLRHVGAVEDLFPLAAAFDEAAHLQNLQVMRDRGARHSHQSRDVDDALFAVAEKPEDFEAPRVAQKLEDVGRFSEVVRFGKTGCRLFKSGIVCVRKLSGVSHGVRC